MNNRWKVWDEFLPYAAYACRIAPRSRIKNSPFEIINGRKPNFINNDTEIIRDESNEMIIERLLSVRQILVNEKNKMRELEIENAASGKRVDDLMINDYVRRRKLKTSRENKWITSLKKFTEL